MKKWFMAGTIGAFLLTAVPIPTMAAEVVLDNTSLQSVVETDGEISVGGGNGARH